ncbi:hypothetical protein ACFL0V_07005 [Nanoarchaeota archaeon]
MKPEYLMGELDMRLREGRISLEDRVPHVEYMTGLAVCTKSRSSAEYFADFARKNGSNTYRDYRAHIRCYI